MRQRRQFREGRIEGVSHGPRYVEGGFGEPIVFLPGLAGLQITRAHHDLAERYRVVAFDIPRLRDAFSGSGTVTRDVALHVGLSLTALGIDTFNLAGCAFGANVALHLAIHQPTRIRALVLTAPTVVRLEQQGPDGRLGPSADPSFGAETEEQLTGLTVPVLVLFGRDDIVVAPETGRIYRDTLPNCRYALVEDAGHAVEDDQPEVFVSSVGDFVDGPESFAVSAHPGLLSP